MVSVTSRPSSIKSSFNSKLIFRCPATYGMIFTSISIVQAGLWTSQNLKLRWTEPRNIIQQQRITSYLLTHNTLTEHLDRILSILLSSQENLKFLKYNFKKCWAIRSPRFSLFFKLKGMRSCEKT